MPDRKAAAYFATETLRDGSLVHIRAQRAKDRDGLLAAVKRTSRDSLFRRFFSAKSGLTEQEISYFTDIDFNKHVALVVIPTDDGAGEILGAGRYVTTSAGQAELAFMVSDTYQGKGIGSLLLQHLITLARQAGLQELHAEVLPQNAPMLAIFKKAGFQPGTRLDPQLLHLVLQLN